MIDMDVPRAVIAFPGDEHVATAPHLPHNGVLPNMVTLVKTSVLAVIAAALADYQHARPPAIEQTRGQLEVTPIYLLGP